MKLLQLVPAILVICLVQDVFTKATTHSERTHAPEKLSEHEHFGGHNEHNAAYDHDAFLGEEEAIQFEHLTPEESRKRLGIIVDRIDKDQDGFVSDLELRDQIHKNQNRYIYRDTERLWREHNEDGDDILTWQEYNSTTYSGMPEEELIKIQDSLNMDIAKKLRRDRNKWNIADRDRDGNLSEDEFPAFLHPEGFDHMKDMVTKDTLEDMDKDKDGLVSLEEFVGDLLAREEPGAPEPDWLSTEREYFMVTRDWDGDGKLSMQELREWIFPTSHDPAESEMKHLLFEADTDKDGMLTKEEIVAKFDLFAGSQATDFGEAIKKHDEF